jgi:hypothetical protein
MDIDPNDLKHCCGGDSTTYRKDENVFAQSENICDVLPKQNGTGYYRVVQNTSTEPTNCSSSTCSNIILDIPQIAITKPTKQGKRWESNEEEELLEFYKSEGVDTIANILGRSPFAVMCRLVHLGLISDVESIRGYSGNIPTFERAIQVKGTNEEIVLPTFEKREKAVREHIPKTRKENVSLGQNKTVNKKPSFKFMITKALTALCCPLDESGGKSSWGSLSYIKKYLETNYNVNPKNKWITKTVSNMLKTGELRCPQGKKVYSLTCMNLPEPERLEKEYDSDEESEESEQIFNVTKVDFEKVLIGRYSDKIAMTDSPKKIATTLGMSEAIVCQIIRKYAFFVKKWPDIIEYAKNVAKRHDPNNECDDSEKSSSEISDDDSYEEFTEKSESIAGVRDGGKSYVPFHRLYSPMTINSQFLLMIENSKSGGI